jgi:hypothetical protein
MAGRHASRAVGWFRQRGLRWTLARLRDEFFSPRFAPTRAVRDAIVRVSAVATRPAHATLDADTLYFVFDLQVCPVAYDVASYLAAAELERRRRGLARVHVVIVPGGVDGFRLELPEYAAVMDVAARRWRLENLVIPVLRLLPSCTGYTLADSREAAAALLRARAAQVYPADWHATFPTRPLARAARDAARAGEPVLPLLRASEQALRYVDRFLEAHTGDRLPVVISLRQYAYTAERNSDVEAWIAFADGLDATRYAPIFVMDTDESLVPPPELARHVVSQAAAWNVPLRMALYERAFVNLAVMHGPMELCWYSEACRYVIFCAIDSAPLTGRESLEREGFEIGAPLPFARPGQRIVWERDSLAAIRAEFDRFTGDSAASARC